MANYADGASSQRGTNREFAGPPCGAREKQVGDVGTGNEQDEADGAEQDEQDSPDISYHVRLERHQCDAGAFVGFGISRGKIFSNAVHVRAGLLDADAGFQPPDGVHTHSDATVAKGRIIPLANGHVDITGAQARDTAGSDTDNVVNLAVQGDASPQNFPRRAKFALPHSVAEDGHGARSGAIFLGSEVAAQQRLEAQSRKEFRGNHVRVQALGFSHAGHIEIVRPKSTQVSERMVFLLPIEEIRIRDGAFLEGPCPGVDGDKFVRVRKWQRIQEHTIHHGK